MISAQNFKKNKVLRKSSKIKTNEKIQEQNSVKISRIKFCKEIQEQNSAKKFKNKVLQKSQKNNYSLITTFIIYCIFNMWVSIYLIKALQIVCTN
jgi:hypothetical protein